MTLWANVSTRLALLLLVQVHSDNLAVKGFSDFRIQKLNHDLKPRNNQKDIHFLVQTCMEAVENAKYATPLKPLLPMRVDDPLDEELDPRSRLREYVDSKRRLVAKKLCYAKPTRSSWPLKQGCMGDLSQ